MSNGQTMSKPSSKKRLRKKLMFSVAGLFIILGLIYLVYWFLVLRHYQETEDAYVAGNQVAIMTQVPGNVTAIYVDNTDFVQQGDVLLKLDSTDAEHAFDRAKDQLANQVRQTQQLMINNKQLQANLSLKQSAYEQALRDYQRREVLANSRAIGKEELQHSHQAMLNAKSALDMAKQQLHANQVLIQNTPLAEQPAVRLAASALRDAWLALQRTRVIAPVSGYISKRSVQLGSQINPGTPLMAVVPSDQLWVNANFKETQLANMRIGQPVELMSDFYGDKVVYQGKVVGLDMGTGSAFSLLPSENATGNWIKVVQRLPVRIALDPQQIKDYPLRIGLSMTVKVDTADSRGKMLADQTRRHPRYESKALVYDLAPVNQLINKIITANIQAKH